MALTSKQDYFSRLVASGKDYTTAYLTAYDWHGSKQGAANEAMLLANRPEIQAKIKALVKPMEIAAQRESLTARQQQIDEIQKRIELCKQKDDENSLIRYYDMLNKIYALYKDTEQETKQDNIISELDINVLKSLSNAN